MFYWQPKANSTFKSKIGTTVSATKSKTKDKETPLMKQYNSIKAKYPDALLLFRVGDFYETFSEDAIKASKALGIVLTQRKNGAAGAVELAGFPHHSLETYMPKLVRAGYRVAICDQLEDPSQTKSIVKRGVTELVTPGVALNDQVLDHKNNNFLAAVHQHKTTYGVSFLDVSTGEFLLAQGNKEYVDKLLQGFKPSEVLHQKHQEQQFEQDFGTKFYTYRLDDWVFTEAFAQELLLKHFGTKSLKGFGVEEQQVAIVAAGAALHYLSETQHDKIKHITALTRIEEDKYVWLDKFTVRNLELLGSPNDGAVSLREVIDQTITPMGARMMNRWIVLPLKHKQPIEARLATVAALVADRNLSQVLGSELKQIGDLERLISKVAVGKIGPREILTLKRALIAIGPLKDMLANTKNESMQRLAEQLNPCDILLQRICKDIAEDAPAVLHKGKVINDGVDEELDRLRSIAYSGKDFLAKIQERESERTGIPSLKISFNNVFGYYLEVRNSHKDKVPAEWIRKQTLVNAERYITEELKEYESQILGAEDKIAAIEGRLYAELVQFMAEYIAPIQLNASIIGRIDCLLSFANLAVSNNYNQPTINDSKVLEIKDGRHPVIETQLGHGEAYISNDVYLDDATQQIIMITGPNMSGKSALLRQTALIVLLAQMGSFVPAKEANIGLVDKIFTRVGASDNISSGESTFMVEMNETASILNNLSDRSLILLDEIGRGTSTYDGISIAWAIADFIHEQKHKAKTLFATHYHELNEMCESYSRIKNYNVSVKEVGNKVIFLRKLAEGGSNHSFGIHVAKMAGMPPSVLGKANKVLAQLEKSHSAEELSAKAKIVSANTKEEMQLSFFQLDDPTLIQIKEELINIDINTLTPVEALMKLNEIKKLTGG